MDNGLGQLGSNPLLQHLTLSSSKISGDRDRDRLTSELSSIDGVRDVDVDTNNHAVDISYDPTIVNEPRLRAAVEQAGYKLSDQGGGDEASQYLGSEMNREDHGDDVGSEESGAAGLQAAPRGSTPGRSG